MAVPSAVLALLTCVCLPPAVLPPSQQVGQDSCSSWLCHQGHWIGPPLTPHHHDSHLATGHHWLEWGKGQNCPAFSRQAGPASRKVPKGKLPAWPGSAGTRAGRRCGCCLQSIDPLSLPNPHLGWRGHSQTDHPCAHMPIEGSWGNKGQARPFPEPPAPSPSLGSQGASFLSSFLPSFA